MRVLGWELGVYDWRVRGVRVLGFRFKVYLTLIILILLPYKLRLLRLRAQVWGFRGFRVSFLVRRIYSGLGSPTP